MRKTKEPDRLSRHASEALALGMSYGKYMAMRYERGLRSREELRKADTHEQEPGKYCAICGKPMPDAGRQRKYCGKACAIQGRRQTSREFYWRRKAQTG